jgi:hypothetical protein
VPERHNSVEAFHERNKAVPPHNSWFPQRDGPRVEGCGELYVARQLGQIECHAVRGEMVAPNGDGKLSAARRKFFDSEPVVPGSSARAIQHLHEGFASVAVEAEENSGNNSPALSEILRD